MAGTIYDALVNIDVADNDAPGQLARIVQQLQREIASLSNTPEVDLGAKLLGSLGTGVLTAQEGLSRLRVVGAELSAEMTRLGSLNPEMRTTGVVRAIFDLERLRHEAEAVERTFGHLALAQGASTRIPQSAMERRLGKLPEEARLDALRQNIQPLPEPSRADTDRLLQLSRDAEVQRMEAANRRREEEAYRQEINQGYDSLSEGQKRKVEGSTEGRFFVADEHLIAAMEDEGASRKEIAAKLREEGRMAQQRVVDATKYPNTEKGQAQLERDRFSSAASTAGATDQVESLRERQALIARKELDAQEKEANRVDSLASTLSEGDSAKRRQAQYNLAIAKADLDSMTSKRAGTVADSEITKAKLRVANMEVALEQVTARELRAQQDAARPQGFFASALGLNRASRRGGGGGFGIPGGGGIGGAGGGGGGIFSNLIDEAGFAAKYYALYRGFSLIEQTLVGVKTATEEYTIAVNNLSIAQGTNYQTASRAAEGYARIGSTMATAPTTAIEGATKFTRSFRNEDGSVDPGAGRLGATVSSLINVLEGPTKLTESMDSLVAVTKAYDLGSGGAGSAYDRATRIGQVYGVPTGGELLGGVAQIADIGKTSGFSLDQLMALVAASMQSTGLTSDAVAGDIKRFLGSDTKTLDSTLGALGGDTQQNLANKLEQLAGILQKLPDERRNDVLRSLGGSRSSATVIPFIEALGKLDATQKAAADLPSAADQAQSRLRTLGGAFQQLSADVQGLFTAISQSGGGAVFGTLVGGLHDILVAFTEMVRAVGSVHPAVRLLVTSIAALAIAGRAAAALQASSAAQRGGALMSSLFPTLGAAAGARGAGVAAAGASRLPQLATFGAGGAAPSLAASASASAAVSMGRLGAGIAGVAASAGAAVVALAPLVAILGTIALIGAASDAANKAQVAGEDALAAKKDADQARKTGNVEGMRAAAQRERDNASAIRKSGDGIGGKTLYGINDAIGFLTGSDQNLSQQRDATVKKLEDYAKKLEREAQSAEDLATQREKLARQFNMSAIFGTNYSDVSGGIKKTMDLGASPSKEADIFADLVNKGIGGDPLQLQALVGGDGKPGASDLVQDILSRNAKSTDPKSRTDVLQKVRDAEAKLLAEARQHGDASTIDSFNQLLQEGNAAYNDALVTDTEAKINSIKAFQGITPASKAQITALVQNAMAAVGGSGDVDRMAKLMSGVDASFITATRNHFRTLLETLKRQAEAIKVAMAAAAAAEHSIAPEGSYNDRVRKHLAGESVAKDKGLDKIQSDIDKYNRAIATMDKAKPYAAPDNSYMTDKKGSEGPSAQDIEIARLQAGEIPGDPLSAASIAIKVARYQLKNAANKQEYFQALKALHEAQYDYAKVLQEQANNEAMLASDITDPVAQARLKLAAARRQLSADQSRGALGDVLAQDRLNVKQSQADAERAAFDQKFNDERTNYELQRTSLSAYLSYLRSQHDYLTSVKNKTRQQVDELNQVDQALKSLTDGLQGQFNLGDIRIPAPYEVRRAMAGGGNYASSQSTSYVTITINGNDTAAMVKVLADHMGQPILQTAGSAPRKV